MEEENLTNKLDGGGENPKSVMLPYPHCPIIQEQNCPGGFFSPPAIKSRSITGKSRCYHYRPSFINAA